MRRFRSALTFLTCLPLPSAKQDDFASFGESAPWFGWVGLLVGGMLAGLGFLFSWLQVPPAVNAVLLSVVWALLSGGLHLDGLADCCDGLFSAAAPQRRLEILRDTHLGTFGAAGLFLHLLLRWTLLTQLLQQSDVVWLALLLAPALGRWLILPAALQKSARPEGLGQHFKQGMKPTALLWAALPLIVLAGWGGIFVLAALGSGVFMTLFWLWLTHRRLGGVTGDVFGLIVETAENISLLTLLLWQIWKG